MVDAVVPRWHGDNYQARIFWENALNLLDPTSCVVEVTFEANGPKAFDDVVVAQGQWRSAGTDFGSSEVCRAALAPDSIVPTWEDPPPCSLCPPW